ncbi:CPBP family intramembrane metalloprotease [Peptoniphilus equinus]|uniref:CPBP family intramembrane metalloprotease n=1 Tax=Peptoniphilus equinus TaxID=3016343 RepID=A0ABY7QU53_9FIRM|nr:CPBP family intramembrane glutamic endopeptidase [Peptoniphilus equinus]WBW50312.1 CPBP family intramembrane metalloprotease [Peptoniphilus equinus]
MKKDKNMAVSDETINSTDTAQNLCEEDKAPLSDVSTYGFFPFGDVALTRYIIALCLITLPYVITGAVGTMHPMLSIGITAVGFFSVLPLDLFAYKELFKWPRPKALLGILKYTLLTFICAIVSAVIVSRFGAVEHSVMEVLSPDSFWIILGVLAVQLIAEELFFVLWFLCLYHKLPFKAPTRLMLAWVGSSLLFGLLHLSTYDYNWVQAVVGVGFVRLGLSAAYIRYGNLTVSYVAHLLYDGLILAVGTFLTV